MDEAELSTDGTQRSTDDSAGGSVDNGAAAAYMLMKKGKRGAAALIAAECEKLDNEILKKINNEEKVQKNLDVSMDETKSIDGPTSCQTEEFYEEDSYNSSESDSESDSDFDAMRQLSRCRLLDQLLDVLLNPLNAINNVGVSGGELDWIRWLMAGGRTLDEFTNLVKQYDYGTCCGLVWTANYVAYRCRTCSISPCMSLCADCFKAGDHAQHDFNMFRSQAGGACDCGDTSVMKADGFCRNHSSGSSRSKNYKKPPTDLLRVAERLMPRLLLRLVQYLRENSDANGDFDLSKHEGGILSGTSTVIDHNRPLITIGGPGVTTTMGHALPGGGQIQQHQQVHQQQHFQPQSHHLQQNLQMNSINKNLDDLQPFLSVLHDLSGLGAAMRRLMTVTLTDERIYKWACNYYYNSNSNVQSYSSQTVLKEEEQRIQQPIASFSSTATSTVNTMYTIYADRVRALYAQALRQYNIGLGGTPDPPGLENTPTLGHQSIQNWNHQNYKNNSTNNSSNSSLSSSSYSSEDESNCEVLSLQDVQMRMKPKTRIQQKKKKIRKKKSKLTSNKISTKKNKYLSHSTFLQEIVFWTVRYEFPQKIVCFLLNMLPDATYKRCLTEAFTSHYGCVAKVLATTRDSDTLSNHIVHISVQLFSNESLAKRMVVRHRLLKVMVKSLRGMMNAILIPSSLHDPTKNRHKVVDCSKPVMKEHCYWPLVSDLNNVLSHRPIAVRFMRDDRLLRSWFSYLSMFQGMNVNCRELGHHVEFEPNTYYAAFSAELEASAYPMWAMLSHLSSSCSKISNKTNENIDKLKCLSEDAETLKLSKRVIKACLKRLLKWLRDVKGEKSDIIWDMKNYINDTSDRHQFTFHLPLHRYLAVFLCQAIRTAYQQKEDELKKNRNETESQNRVIHELLHELIAEVYPLNSNINAKIGDSFMDTSHDLPASNFSPNYSDDVTYNNMLDDVLLSIAQHPLRAQAAFYEIMTQGAWVRNGLQIKGQAMTYVQSNFCISMVDADIYLLQLCLSEVTNVSLFMHLILDKFKADEWMKPCGSLGLPSMMKGPSGGTENVCDNGNDGSIVTGNSNENESGIDYNGSMNDVTPSSLESLLVFLATLVSVRTNLCTDEDYNYCQTQLEMVTLLCVSDKTHSQLMELMPERCCGGGSTNTVGSGSINAGTSSSVNQSTNSSDRDFETVLRMVAEYKKPQYERSSGTMQQGLYVPKGSSGKVKDDKSSDVWLKLYDPVHVLLRAVHRRDFQSSMDRYTAFVRSRGLLNNRNLQLNQPNTSSSSSTSTSSSTMPWPPYRNPRHHHPAYQDPRRLLLESRAWHAVAWHSLYRAARGSRDISEHTLSLLVFLLDQSVALYQERQEKEKSKQLKKVALLQTQNMTSDIVQNMYISHELKSSSLELKTKQYDEPMETDSPPQSHRFQIQENFIGNDDSLNINYSNKKEEIQSNNDDNICLKRRIKIKNVCDNVSECETIESQSLLERWYQSDDLSLNLRTIITFIDLPPKKIIPPHEYLSKENIALSIGSMTSGTGNLLEYLGGALSSSSTFSSRDRQQNINQQQQSSSSIVVPSLATLASDEISPLPPASSSSTSATVSYSILPSTNIFNSAIAPFYSNSNTTINTLTTTSVNTTSSTSMADSALNRVKQHLQFLSNNSLTSNSESQSSQTSGSRTKNPSASHSKQQTNYNDEISNSNSNLSGSAEEEKNDKSHDSNMSPGESVSINESIISLLLRLHSQLSGRPDSYQPPSSPIKDFSQQEDQPGDGAYYIGRLLDRIASMGGESSGFSLTYECVTRARNELWPRAVVAREAATRDLEERERRERKRRAHDKQRRMMEEMARAQRAFIENARLSGELELSTSMPSTLLSDDQPSQPRQSSSNSFSMDYDEEMSTSNRTTMVTNSPENQTEVENVSSNTTLNQQKNNSKQIITDVANESKNINIETEKPGKYDNLNSSIFETTVDCVICNQTVTVNEQQKQDPVGLVILVQGTNVLAHRRRKRKREQGTLSSSINNSRVSSGKCRRRCGDQGCGQAAGAAAVDILQHGEDVMMVEPEEEDSEDYSDWPGLPPSPSKHHQFLLLQTQDSNNPHESITEGIIDNSASTYGAYVDRRRQLLNQHFRNLDITVSNLQSGGRVTFGGVHVQTCGHYLHLRCWRSYLASLRGAQRYASDRGEYSCPLCRQLANSVLPLTFENRFTPVQPKQQSTHSVMYQNVDAINQLVQFLQSHLTKSRYLIKNPPQPLTSGSILSSRIMGVLSESPLSSLVEDHNSSIESSRVNEFNYYSIVVNSMEQNHLTDAINRCVDDMIISGNNGINSAISVTLYPSNPTNITWHSVVLIAWTNIQVELIQRDNTLLPSKFASNLHHQSSSKITESFYHYYDMLPKRSCTASLLRVLNARSRSCLVNDQDDVLLEIWSQLMGQEYVPSCSTVITNTQEVSDIRQKQLPLLLRDPSTVLLQLILLLPTSIEYELFDTLVKLIYNMQLYATALKVAVSSSLYNNYKEISSCDSSHNTAISIQNSSQNKLSFSHAVCLAKNLVLHQSDIEDDIISEANEFLFESQCDSINKSTWSCDDDFESYARQCSLPFLRFATLLRRHIYGGNDDQLLANLSIQEIEDLQNKKTYTKQFSRDDYEFQMLVRHLDLVKSVNKTMSIAMEACNWPVEYQNDNNIPIKWLSSVRQSLKKIAITTNSDDDDEPLLMMTARQLLGVDDDDTDSIVSNTGVTVINWTGPRLLKLPHLYDDVFQYYHGRPCHRCHGVPRETSVCLVCGTVVCLKENCCKTENVCEAVQHSIECGGGTAMFLVVTSSSVVVIRGKRACLWGSVYLDAFGEEDRELKRGKPLYLSAERYRLLERQWLAHRFDHTNKKWVWHREQL